ncbi:MAG: DUF1844 domain-containing protein [Desulfomonilia bacterium]|jgi:hypothetical protein
MEDEKKGYTFTDRRKRDERDLEGGETGDTSGGAPGDAPLQDKTPVEIDFSTLIMSFASAALISMGLVPDPATGSIVRDLVVARQNIEIIGMLKDKTRGNLSADEEKLVENILYELRMNYIESQKR